MPLNASTAATTRMYARARIGVALLFFTNGALFANLLPRYPGIKAELGISNTQFGLAVAAFPTGALLAGLAAAVVIRRFRSSRAAVAGTIATGLGIFAAGSSSSLGLLALGLFVAGAMDAVTDVAQNLHGLRVQQGMGRSVLNGFHAIWSLGAVAGGLMGGAAAGLAVPLGLHLGTSAALCTLLALLALRMLIPGPDPLHGPPEEVTGPAPVPGTPLTRTRLRLALIVAALVGIAAGGAVVEDVGSSWSSLYLTGELHAATALAASGFVALVGMQFIGRLAGDRLVDRFGQRAVARAGGILVAAGMGTALAFPSVPVTIAGFGAAGLGVATWVPAAMHSADLLPGLKPGTGLAVVSWLMRFGFLLNPPLVGMVADATSLRVGLLAVPLVGLLVVFLSVVLPGPPGGHRVGASVRSGAGRDSQD